MDFSLTISAPVSRIIKYFHSDGIPLITTGGYAYNFEDKKDTCNAEYHLLTRVGLTSYKTIALFMIQVMKK